MGTERQRELRRRRSRSKKIDKYGRRAKTASPSEKTVLAQKIRKLTPGGEQIIERLGLAERSSR